MLMTTALATFLILLQCSAICVTIKVPVVWSEGDSEVKNNGFHDEEFSVDVFKPNILKQELVPVEYFQYTAKKPQFAIDIANFHGVPSPASHYKAYPVRPYTGQEKPDLGKHRIQDQNRDIFVPLQKYTKNKYNYNSQITPTVSNYDVYHPYKAEEPALQEIYKDPVLDKIRNDLRDTSKRLQNYEKEAGKPEVENDEYLDTPEEIDRKKVPQKNIPVKYETHRPQRRPIYYRPLPKYPNRDQILNHRFRHPWNQNFVKIRPAHYQPLKNHLQKLRQHHALTYDDEHNEYPQVPLTEEIEQPSDGYDIYERGRQNYVQLRNNLDESINQAVYKNRPLVSQKLELQANDEHSSDEDDEFVPIKSFAQVRKTETTKHVPKAAAFEDADTYEEIRNAPRLKEAVKITKGQTVYTEEGYEDSAYDHAGEQKHASDHEAHGGFLKENEISSGKYKIPSVNTNHDDENRSAYINQLSHGKKWSSNDKDLEKETDSEQYTEVEHEQSENAEDAYRDKPESDDNSHRNKRQNELIEKSDITTNHTDHDVDKREVNFKVPDIDLNSTLLTEDEILEIVKDKILSKDDIKRKYPYYFKNITSIHRDSPLRYAENLKLIPKKSKGGTEFYDSRSPIVCPEVDEKVDAIPKKLKTKGHPDSKDDNDKLDNEDEKEDKVEEQPRLNGLGDKIDCFKAKYFGENPLDSPFFKEEIISNPEPVTAPNLLSFKLTKDYTLRKSNKQENETDELKNKNYNDIFDLISKMHRKKYDLIDTIKNEDRDLLQSLQTQSNIYLNRSELSVPSNIYTDIIENTRSITTLKPPELDKNTNETIIYESFTKKEDVTQNPVRTKRAAPFMYEPYKIIRDGQVQESKKTTTTSNISPLIKQLQSSRVVDKVTKPEKDVLKWNSTSIRRYKDIGKNDRVHSKNARENTELPDTKFIDINVDKRRGEPRYELRALNHKSEYTPVTNKKAMSKQDFEAHIKNDDYNKNFTSRTLDNESVAASNNVQRTYATTSSSDFTSKQPTENVTDAEDHDEEYDYEDDDEEDSADEDHTVKTTTTSTTTTTTLKPIFRKKIRTTTTTEIPPVDQEIITPKHKLKLVTRFRSTPPPEHKKIHIDTEGKSKNYKNDESVDDIELSKYKEKKKKITKSTLVTDTKKYGDDENNDGDVEDDMRKEEVDALIGIKHDMNEYIPLYEKEELQKRNKNPQTASSEEDYDDNDSSSGEDDEDDEDDNEDETDDDSNEEDTEDEQSTIVTTTEPTKRTLVKTTDAPLSTTQINYNIGNPNIKPTVSKKKIEIHKELPVNKSAPHITQFKQDIKEVEIVKEIPRKATNKTPKNNLDLLELYKDENLATNINKLKDVEVFKQNLDLTTGPKHGGNYRSAKLTDLLEKTSSVGPLHGENLKIETKDELDENEDDAETSQTEYKKSIEFDSLPPRMHGGNLKSNNKGTHFRRADGKNAKLIELVETTEIMPRARHGGNLKSIQETRSRSNKKSERLTELDDNDKDDDDDSSSGSYGGSSGSYSKGSRGGRPMHGGNYRSAKLVQGNNEETRLKASKESSINRGKPLKEATAAVLLNSFVQAAPILTTTPAYILDPSKRMYYYVD
ncbi:MATH and LRR domain-containing protein PFE0570w-like [Plodia interpunctella]|uniref:MATH and LRR domain-containing protein PFE0570w-like n=1 Tax=Plodia interpunctella TaxID=58824 RepID=UPI002368D52F|nr:MATH and LRR domain-containing protein PFE0570w-like [Plodia interpunctella]